MRRFIVDVIDDKVEITSEIVKHAKVIRLNLNEKIELVTRDGNVYLAHVDSIDPLDFYIDEKYVNYTRELPFKLVLFAPLLKGDKFDFIIQKATELGVSTIVPYISERAIVRLSKDDFSKKAKNRYQKIIEKAVEQSNRDFIPELSELHTLKELASFKFDRAFIAYEEESMKGSFIPNEYIPTKDSIVVAMIGPEGGFSKDEVDKIVKMGFESISLGKRILKAETACCYLLSILSYKGECQWLTLSLFHI